MLPSSGAASAVVEIATAPIWVPWAAIEYARFNARMKLDEDDVKPDVKPDA